MQKNLSLKLLPSEAASEKLVKSYIARAEGMPPSSITGFIIQKQSIDARGKQVWINLSVTAFINEPFRQRDNALIAQHGPVAQQHGPLYFYCTQ